MKKKSLLSMLFVGLLGFATTSTVVSCKDYDDDISNLNNRVDKLSAEAALHATKAELNSAVDGLKSELNDAKTQLQNEINKKADKTEITRLETLISDTEKKLQSAIDKKADQTEITRLEKLISDTKTELQNEINKKADKTEITRLEGLISGLETRIGKAEENIKKIDEILAKKADKTYVDSEIEKLYTKITGETDKKLEAYLKTAVFEDSMKLVSAKLAQLQTDLDNQTEALKLFKEKCYNDSVKFAQQIEGLGTEVGKVNARVDSLINYPIKELKEAVGDLQKNKLDITAFNKWVKETYEVKVADLQSQIDKVNNRVDILEMYVKNSLRSLVFIPDCYYWGIEAAKINLEATYSFNVPAAQFDKKEAKGYSDNARYDSTLFKTTYGYAKYHKNPSNATIDTKNLSLVSFDRDYVLLSRGAVENYSKNAAPAGLSIVTDSVVDENGDLYVKLNVKDVSKVKKVLNSSLNADALSSAGVTVFALQYKLNEAGKDTTITSDYAALLASEDTVSYKIGLEKDPMAVSALSPCGVPSPDQRGEGHAMQTVNEANGMAASYELPYGETIDVAELVSAHRIFVNDGGEEKEVSAAEFKTLGYSYEFALTELDVNGENQSKHATLTGSKLTTNKCDYDAILYGYTPVVRVVLKDAQGNKLDYGYIKFQITGDICKWIGTIKYDVEDAAKVKSYWYEINGAENGKKFDEIHYNVKTPEEAPYSQTPAGAAAWTTADMDIALALANNKVINVFTSENVFDASKVVVNDIDGDVNMVEKKYVQAGDFIFTLSKQNNGKQYKGDTGATYKMHISENGDSLIAHKVGATEEGADTVVATLLKNVPMAQQKLVLNHDSEYAKDLLNYKGRYELSDDFLTAYVGLGLTVKKAVLDPVQGDNGTITYETAYEECKVVETDNVWPSRFIRPINLAHKNPTPIQDAKRGQEAAEYKGQPAYLHDILAFTDWQNIPVEYVSDTTNCLYKYYGIESVEIIDKNGNALNDGDDVIENADNVLTNIANPTTDEAKVMKNVIVGGAVTLTFKAATETTPAHIWYINNGNTVSEVWWFEVPVRVNYYWGSFTRRVKVYVDPTYNKN